MATKADRTATGVRKQEIPRETLAEALAATWKHWPTRPALVAADHTITYAQLGRAIRMLVQAYRQLGIGPGDRIVCSVSNRPEKIIALGAAWLCGAVHVGVDYQSTARELSAVIEHTQATALLYESVDAAPEPFQTLQAIGRDHPGIHVIGVGDRPVPGEYLDFSALVEETDQSDDLGPNGWTGSAPSDPAMIFISSGTTGKPKAALGYQGNLCHRWQRLAAWLGFGPDDIHLAQLPLSHGFGLMMAVSALLTGGRLVLLRHFSGAEVLDVITHERVTVCHGAPAHFKLMLRHFDHTRHDLSNLRLSVGTAAFFTPSLVRSIWNILGVRFMFMYGASEGVGVATTDPDDILRGSVGRPAPGSVAIVGPDRSPLPPGERGEIAFSRKVFPVRYWEEARSSSSDGASEAADNWYYSGDLGHLDEEGRLYVFGRIKHQIDRGGLKVDPVEVEAALLRYPGVVDAAVLGMPNPILGETVCACLVPVPDQTLSLATLRAFLKDELAPYKLPEEMCVLDQIPRTSLGKVDMDRLRAEVLATNRQEVERR